MGRRPASRAPEAPLRTIERLGYDQQLTGLELAADRRSAIVHTGFNFDIGGVVINLNGTSVDTLVRRNGRILVTRSDGKVITRIGG